MNSILLACVTTAMAAEPGDYTEAIRRLNLGAHNDNFVVTAPSPELARDVLKKAEQYRDEIALVWLGDTLPPNVGPTAIRVKLSETEDTGTTWVASTPRRLSHSMWLTTSRGRALGSTLRHEMTHVVLATRYPGQLPPWVNEGAASLQDDAERVAIRRKILAWFVETGNWPPLTRFLEADRIAARDQQAYTVASSLTRFLLSRGKRARLLAFAVEARSTNYSNAARKYYGIDGVAALQSQWETFVTREIRDAGRHRLSASGSSRSRIASRRSSLPRPR